MDFDPDSYLAGSSSTTASGFDPDAYLGNSPAQSSSYSLSGLAKNILPDIGRNLIGAATQIKQGAYDIPKALIQTPTQLAQGMPYANTEMGEQTASFANQTPQVTQAVSGVAQDPLGAMYRNPVTTALAATAIGSKILPYAQTGAIKGMSAALGPSQEAIEARMANPEGIANASSYADLAQKLPDTLNTLKDQISQHDDTAASTLRDSNNPAEGAIPKDQINSIFGDLIADLKIKGAIVGPGRKAAIGKLQSLYKDINQIGSENPNLTEMDLKDIIRSVDKNINWQDKGLSDLNSSLTDFRGKVDQLLKTNNPEYAQAMQPVDDKIGLLNDLNKAFSLTNQTGEGLQPTDTTISKMQSLPTERKSITQNLVQQLKQATGQDYTQQAKDYGYARQFQGGTTNGSRRVMALGGVGAAIGAKFGGTPGAVAGQALGNVAGLVADKYAGSIAGGLADVYAPVYQGISRLGASAPVRSLSPVALSALLNQYYAQQAGSQRTSQ